MINSSFIISTFIIPLKAYTSLSEIQKDLHSGTVSCVSLVENYLKLIDEKKNLNAFLEVFSDSALAKAKEVDGKTVKGKLAGMVVALKDNICYKGHKVSASSEILAGFVSPYSSTVVERLLAEDAIIIGRTNCDEFAMGSSNENSAFGNVLNPHDIKRVPGGSSGGSATAVAAGLCLAALGTDTGGSIRQPASFCGIVGMKPTYGRISRWGIIAYASSFDQVGPLTNNVEDAAKILEVISGVDEFDSTLSTQPVAEYSKQLGEPEKMRIAYLEDCFEKEGLDPEIKTSLMATMDQLKKEGHVVEPVRFPYLDFLVPAYYVLTTAEASSNLARYDGIRYGYRSKNATDLESTYKKSRSEGFGVEVKRRIMLGTFVLSAGYYDAYYSKGQKVRRLLRDKTQEIFDQYDLILLPTTPGVAFEFGANSADPIKMYLEDIFTVQANLTGFPAISVPAGKNRDGLPFGVQLMAKRFEEGTMFAMARHIHELIV
jgi:aspartyl-tRNA(Asn)/glutamyl-tRNA(Gln) amidotransferase subunit A